MKIFRVVYRSTGITTVRLMVADGHTEAFIMAEKYRLGGESIDKVEDVSGGTSVYIQALKEQDNG